MHGRNSRSPIFPLRFSREKIQGNLEKIVSLIKEYQPDILTLQEVDRGSMLSGNFNQFDFLSAKLQYPYKYFAPSCSVVFMGKSFFVSGNAIFSKYPLENCEAFVFAFSFPTDRMGFAVADARLAGGRVVTVASVHLVWLDWIQFNSRAHQLDLIRRVIEERKSPAVIAGDMNCDFLGKEASLRSFVNRLNLNVYDPENKNINTSPSWNPDRRIDWILLSKEIGFISYKNINNQVSDHLAVFAELQILN